MKNYNPYSQSQQMIDASAAGIAAAANAEGNPAEQQVPVDGFRQVLEMLKIADPAFRDSLLRRLAARDIQLAATLRQDLRSEGLI